MRGQCERCKAWRSKVRKCVTCGKRLCGCCSFRSRAGLVCCDSTQRCHKAALVRHAKMAV